MDGGVRQRSGSEAPQVGVVIAEDDPSMRSALQALISHEPSLKLLGAGADADEAIELATRCRPDVCVVDVGMPAGGGPHATRMIRKSCPGTQVLALSGRDDRRSVVEMVRAGACGYLVKGAGVEELVRAVHDAARGQRPLSPQAAEGVIDALSEHLTREDERLHERQLIEARIDRVLSDRRLGVVLQPIVDLRTRETVAFEALARVSLTPVRPPRQWFDDAAQVGRLAELELAAAAAAFAKLPQLPDGIQLAVNVSPATAATPAFEQLLPADEMCRRVVIEITEHAPIDDYDALTARLRRLRGRGIRLAIDDAGAGFASLRHILRLAPDVIKTDMTLTRGIATDRAARALTRAIISFAAEIEATVIAEGIESRAEMLALRELGVVYGQGFYLGRPATRHRFHRRARPAERQSAPW
jgi:EAL domain-containing protein (putative c-di-GMP-specific phosphodiesterase class I)/CheY-like chemotaxis protein